MPAKIDIPLVFPAAEGALKRELERLASAVYKYTQDADIRYEPRPSISKVYTSGTIAAAFDVITRVSPATGETVTVQLPRPDPRNGGRRVIVQRMTTVGAIVISPIDCSVNSYDRYIMTNAPGYVTARFDSENYFTDLPGCADFGEGL